MAGGGRPGREVLLCRAQSYSFINVSISDPGWLCNNVATWEEDNSVSVLGYLRKLQSSQPSNYTASIFTDLSLPCQEQARKINST